MKREGRGNSRADREYVNLYGYAATLKKEDKLDHDERAGVELSVVRLNTSDLLRTPVSFAAPEESGGSSLVKYPKPMSC